MRTIRIVLFTLSALGGLSGFSAMPCEAASYQSNGSESSVQALHRTARDGDTITLPTGTFTWNSGIRLTKAIILQGNGPGNTIIRDAAGHFFDWDFRQTSNGRPRMTGIEIQGAAGGGMSFEGINTNGTVFRMDNCKITNLGQPITFNTVIGVVDHNTISQSDSGIMTIHRASHWNNDALGKGDKSWAAPSDFGSGNFLFFEDNTFTCTASRPGALTDSWDGGRFVIRHNLISFLKVTNHGTETTGRSRGVRAYEVYNNTFTAPTNPQTSGLGLIRSGVVVWHDNNYTGWSPPGYGGTAHYPLTCFRMFSKYLFGGADGTSEWDVNSGPHYHGTAAADTQRLTVTVTGANFTPNQWKDYTIKRTSNKCGKTSTMFAVILSNTSNTITYGDDSIETSHVSLAFCAGDTFDIYKVEQALDQPGRSQGSLITGNPPVKSQGWNDQITEPCYSWNNKDEFGKSLGFNSDTVPIRVNEHFLNNTVKPAYTPYNYPHPLVTGGPTPTSTATPSASHNRQKKRSGARSE